MQLWQSWFTQVEKLEEQIAEIKLDIDKYKVRGALTWVHVGSHMGTDASAWHCRGRAGRTTGSGRSC